MEYKEFINIFYDEYDLNLTFSSFLKRKIYVERILKEKILKVNINFLFFLIENEVYNREVIIRFYKIYKKRGLNYVKNIYSLFIEKKIRLNELEDIDNIDDLILKKYSKYLKVDINKIDEIDKHNILIFLSREPYFYKYLKGDKYKYSIRLENAGLKKDLYFLKILGIERIDGLLDVSNNRELKSLRGCVREVINLFCIDTGIENFGIEEDVKVYGKFDCSDNKNLKSLKDGPSDVFEFYCHNTGILKLEMNNYKEIDIFSLDDNNNLRSLNGIFNNILVCNVAENLNLEELNFGREVKFSSFYCVNNKKLKSLKGGPIEVKEEYNCYNCGIENFDMEDGVRIEGDFICSKNPLKSLKNGPKFVGGNFICNNCKLDKIDLDTDIEISGDLICLEGNNVKEREVIDYIYDNKIKLKGRILY